MSERVVVITGASAGIGEALAMRLGARRDALVLAARREPELRRVADACGTRARVVVADVTKRADVERIRDEALAAFRRVDVWVNNAGRGIARPVMQLTDDDVDQMIALNVKSALYGMQAIVPHFQQRGEGHLVNVSSFLGRVPAAPLRSAYSAAKAALNSLTANLRMDLRASHPRVRVSVVMPGVVSTEFAKNVVHAPPGAGVPPAAGPFVPQTADEVAAAIVALLDAPRAEIYTNPAHPAIVRAYYEDVGAWESATR